MSGSVEPHRWSLPRGRRGFLPLLHAEWTKFRTLRGWMGGTAAAVAVAVLISLLSPLGSHSSIAGGGRPGGGVLGPDGEAVQDSFYFVHRPLGNDGSITMRVSSLTGGIIRLDAVQPGVQPWAKAGLIAVASARQGAAYAAVMVTGGHGVRLQYDYTHDVAGSPGGVSPNSPRWLRLARSGDTLTGYESNDGSHWAKLGSATLSGLPATVEAGLFVTSPPHEQVTQSLGSSIGSSQLTSASAVFDHVGLRGQWPLSSWSGEDIGPDNGPGAGQTSPLAAEGFRQAGDAFTVSGSGDIAPIPGGTAAAGRGIESTLAGTFAGLIMAAVLGASFITAEYRRGLILTTIAANPSPRRVLAAKALIIAGVAFGAGLAASAIALPLGEHILRANGNYLYPANLLTDVRVLVGTAALFALTAVLALAVGVVLRRGAWAITIVIALLVLPYLVAVTSALPEGAAAWLLRLTPAAAFAVQQTLVRYPQVAYAYTPANGYLPMAPWAGFAVLCAYAAVALGVAALLLRRRDA